MFHFIFVAKTLAVTLVLVVLLQIRIGETTLEQKAMFFIHDSPIVEPLREVADGSVRAIRNGFRGFLDQLGQKGKSLWSSEDQPGKRSLGIQIERSQAYLKEQAQKVKEKVAEEISSSQAEPKPPSQ